MKLLSEILYRVRIEEVTGLTNLAIENISFDSRKIEKFSLFVATRGTASDGHKFIDMAVGKGAIAVVCEEMPASLQENVTYIKVKDTSEALGLMASNFYDNPSEKIKLVGVTGTNGKTTSVTLLFDLFRSLGYKCGLISTVRYRIDREEIPSTHTTPDALTLNSLIAKMVEAGCTHCFMEVSSHAVVQHRITGLSFKLAAFSNITHDHLDYHKTFENYVKAKKGFFDQLGSQAIALVNRDDKNGMVMLQNTKAEKKTYGLLNQADFKARIIESHFQGTLLNIDGTEVWTKLIGNFNAYNALMVYAVALLLKENRTNVLTGLSNLSPVEGRFQFIRSPRNVTGIVDYAHTPDALKNVLETIRQIRKDGQKIITVVGCGGDRDPFKRPVMAKIACELSDRIVLTSDNPRSEDPEAIIAEMKKGVDIVAAKRTISITDRAEAINTAVQLAADGDIILVAGKGHEKYQEIKGVKHPFDDMEIIKQLFNS